MMLAAIYQMAYVDTAIITTAGMLDFAHLFSSTLLTFRLRDVTINVDADAGFAS